MSPSQTALFFGRLHPVLIHLPIGFIVLLAFLEVLARFRRFQQANSNVGAILALAVPVAVVAAILGLLLSKSGGYDARLLQWHKYTGIGTAAACAVAALLYYLDLKKAYRWCLAATVAVLAVASHLGASLTHGSDYLTQYAPAPLRALFGSKPTPKVAAAKPKNFADLPVFAGVVQPLFQQDCVSCHGPQKSKGGLRLDSFQAVLKGSKDGPVVVPGKSAQSDLFNRLTLAPEDDDHMPPDGKPQPSDDEIALLQWWLDAGAPENKLVRELNPPASVTRFLAARFGPAPAATAVAATAAPPKPLAAALPLASRTADELGIVLCGLSATEPWLECNASIAGSSFGDAQLAKLAELGPNIRWLDLGSTGVTDAGLARLSATPNLTRLHLERTAITDAGLTNLTGLANLQYLNLYGTTVTDAGLQTLQKLPKLKQLYLWQTKVTPAAAKAFADARLDKTQLQKWEAAIEQLKDKIHDQHITLDLGTPLESAAKTNNVAATNHAPVNAFCPVSGKPIDATKTVLHDGVLVAFCCDDCKAKFQKDPKPYLAKLALNSKAPNPATTTTK